MVMELMGHAALVTGGSKGIGRGIALALAAQGCDVALSYASDPQGANATVERIRAFGRRAFALHCDIAQPSSVAALFAQAEELMGALDIVVANAGIELIDIPFVNYTEAEFDRVFDVNAKGTFFTLQHAARRVREGGRIVLVCSNTTQLALPGFAVYGASKLAPKYFVEVLAKELGPRGITVNSVSPGVTQSAGVFTSTPANDAYLEQMTAATPLRRLGTPEDVANAVLLLVSAQAGFITGHHLASDGGAAL
jgi:3-oxoacyl-[acyl-carrier protein] reductase